MVSRNYIETSTALLENGLNNFENDLSNIEGISQNAYNNPRIRRISFMGPEYSIQDHYSTITLVDDFKGYFAAAGIITDCGIIFSNDIVLTTKRLHYSGTEFYGSYYRHGDVQDYNDWLKLLSNEGNSLFNRVHLIPFNAINTTELKYNAITYVQNFSNFPERESFFFAALEIKYILSRLAIDEVLREGRVTMYDPAGKIILNSNPEKSADKNDVTIEMKGMKRGIRVTVDIPKNVFSGKLAPFRNIAFIFLFILIGTGIILSFIFAQGSTKPVREQIEQHKTLQRENLLMQLLYGSVYTKDEQIKSYFPDFPDVFRIAIIDLPKSDEKISAEHTIKQTMVRNLAESLMPPGGYFNYSGETLKLIIPDGKENIPDMLRNMAYAFKEKLNIPVKIALSETVEDIRETHTAFQSAQSLLRLPNMTSDSVILQNANNKPPSYTLLDTSRLYELILYADEERAVNFINNMYNELCREYTNENDIQQVFFLFRRTLMQIVNDLELEIDKKVIPVYDSQSVTKRLFEKINESIGKICTAITARHAKQNADFEQSILKFVETNLTNPNLYTKMVTLNFHINENRLQNIFRNWTGKSFLEYVESGRMTLARELLMKSEKTISQITRECGYSTENAFYKAFKRFYNMAPSDLRH